MYKHLTKNEHPYALRQMSRIIYHLFCHLLPSKRNMMTCVELQDAEGNLIIWIDWITSVYQEDVGQKGKDLVFFVFTF